jgi:fructosamine-3-kinase
VLAAVGAALGSEVASHRTVHGGDVAAAAQLRLADGREVFAKARHGVAPETFRTEAEGLRWLADAGVVRVPRVLAVLTEPPALVLEWVEVGHRAPDEARFGTELAALHLAGAPCFGRRDRRVTGSRSLPNEPFDTWAESYAHNRLLPLADLAEREGALPASAVVDLRAVAARLEQLGGPPEPPARLHGDLWAGNRIVDASGASWLVDPAAHGGHREFDLAMMRLFGGFGPAAFEAYDQVRPLADGWQERVQLHQLAPLVVHAVKFGGGYVGAAVAAIDRYR